MHIPVVHMYFYMLCTCIEFDISILLYTWDTSVISDYDDIYTYILVYLVLVLTVELSKSIFLKKLKSHSLNFNLLY